MTKLTDEEILKEVELLIEDFRYARGVTALQEHKTYHALKNIAGRLRAETPKKISEAHRELAASLEALEKSRTALGLSQTSLMDLAYKTRAYWMTIEQALAFFEDARKVDAS